MRNHIIHNLSKVWLGQLSIILQTISSIISIQLFFIRITNANTEYMYVVTGSLYAFSLKRFFGLSSYPSKTSRLAFQIRHPLEIQWPFTRWIGLFPGTNLTFHKVGIVIFWNNHSWQVKNKTHHAKLHPNPNHDLILHLSSGITRNAWIDSIITMAFLCF